MGLLLWVQEVQEGESGRDGCGGEGEDAEGHQPEAGGADSLCERGVKVAMASQHAGQGKTTASGAYHLELAVVFCVLPKLVRFYFLEEKPKLFW